MFKLSSNQNLNTVLHILNKPNALGGIETLLQTVLENTMNCTLKHKTFFIANSATSRWFFQRSVARMVVFFSALIRLGFLIIQYKLRGKQLILVFHSAEAHFLSCLVEFSTRLIGDMRILVYLHQSPNLYPVRLKKYIVYLLKRGTPSISYSRKIQSAWNIPRDQINSKVIHAIPRPQNYAKAHKLEVSSTRLNLLFVGRDVFWKRLDLAIDFASVLKLDGLPVSLYIAGGDANELKDRWAENYPSLDLNFLGQVEWPDYASCDFLLVPCNHEDSRESLGIAGFESISQKTPVLIRNPYFTDFSELPGIYTFEWILGLVKNCGDIERSISVLKGLRLTESQVKDAWGKTLSPQRYIQELENFLVTIKR